MNPKEEWLLMLGKLKYLTVEEETESYQLESLNNGLVVQTNIKDKLFWELTDAGELYLREEIGFEGNPYRSFHPQRCLVLASHYIELSKQAQGSWKTKDDLMVITMNHHVPDAIYQDENKIVVGVKVIEKESPYSFVELIEQNRDLLGVEKMFYLMSN